MEVLKLQLQEEVEDPFRAKLHTAEAEVRFFVRSPFLKTISREMR